MKYIIYRNNNYHFRVRIPSIMKPYFNNRCFYARSLRTNKKIVAISYTKILCQKFTFIKQNIEMDMQTELIIQLVEDFTNQVFKDTEENLYNTDNNFSTFYLMLEDTIKVFQENYHTNNFKDIDNEIDTIIPKLEKLPSEDDINLIGKQLLGNHIDNLKTIKSNIENDIYTKSKPKLKPILTTTKIVTSSTPIAPILKPIEDEPIKEEIEPIIENKDSKNKLDFIYKQYKKHNIKTWNKDTISNNDVVHHILNLFFTKEKDLSKITNIDLLDLVNILYDIPNRLTLRAEFKGKDLNYILDHCEELDTISIRTINKYITTLNRFFEYCSKLDYLSTILKLDKINNTSITKARVAYESFDLEEINKNLVKLDFDKQLIIRTALYSGLRLGEIVQLRKKDIKFDKKDNILYFDINNEDGKKVKNKTSIRRVPIHPNICADIENHIINIEDNEDLFKITSPKFSKWYRVKFNRRLITMDKRKVFHSFRHNAVVNMLHNGQSLENIAGVVGHTQDLGMTFSYAGSNMPLPQLRDTIFSINYDLKI